MDHGEDTGLERGDAIKGLVLAAGIAVAVALAGGAWWWLTRPEPAPPASTTAPAPAGAPSGPREPAAVTEPAPAPVPEPARRRDRVPREKPAPVPEPEAPPPAPAGPVLVVESDVPGASVFFNRKYLGTTPLRSTDVAPGAGQLNASAEGYDGIVQTVEIAASGPTEVTVRFKEVRLDASVPVVHKHGMGSCEGTLRATTAGLRYDTSNRNDAFALGFAELETFELDYLQKALKVKKRGGKTWNFTTKAANADPLFVFHRDVEKARARLTSP